MENIQLLQKAGLNEKQAKAYYCLLENGAQTPLELSENIKESRENCYAILKRLAELELVEQLPSKKTTYRALNPSNLEVLAEKRRKLMAKNEKAIKDNISSLLSVFYSNNEMPGSRTLEGIEGIKEVYNDMLRVKEDVYFIRTKADKALGHDGIQDSFIRRYRDRRPLLGIHTYGLTPVLKLAIQNQKNGRDRSINFHRTWMPENAYESPVEIDVYGDKVAFISFGESMMATIITSPAIAESIRWILKTLMDFYRENFQQEW
ncbi:MAG: hypothetical protein MJ154_03040 [Candidatus Saccharibacteria bacterium]|nr:hypothetical protein [Candidatus Saccharibacteria bacterium]